MTAFSETSLLTEDKKLTDWTHEPKLSSLKEDIDMAKSSQQEQVSKVDRWTDALKVTGSAGIKKVEGRSSVQPKLIRKQAEWRYSSLSEPFLSAGKLFTVSPVTWEDTEAARQNELVLNWQFRTKLNPVFFIDQYVHACVDEGTVAVRVGWNRETKTSKVKAPVYAYYPVADPALAQSLLELASQAAENPKVLDGQSDDVVESVRYSMEVGEPYTAKLTRYEEVEQEEVIKNEPTVEVVDIRNLYIDPSCNGNPDNALFMAYTFEVTKGELERDKRYKNLNKVSWSDSILAQPDHATNTPQEFNFKDDARKKVVATEYWGYYDIDGEGHLTPIVATWIGDVLIRMEKNPYPDGKLPFVVVPFSPVLKSPYGEPDAELLEDNQRILGAVTRGMIDSMARSANGQRGMAKGMLDPVNKRRFDKGLDYEFNQNVHPANGVVEHKYPEIPASAMNLVQLQNIEAESLTGVQTYSQEGMSGASLGPTAAGVRGSLSASARREMAILRRLARGITQVGTKIVAMNQEFMSEQETIRVTNDEFVTVNRDELHGNFDLEVQISTAEEDAAKANELSFMMQTIGPLGDLPMNRIVLTEIAKLKRMPALAEKIKNYEPEPDPLAQKRMELEVAKLEAEIMEIQSRKVWNEARAKEAKAEADSKDQDFLRRQDGVDHQQKLELIHAQSEANQDLKVTSAILEDDGSPRAGTSISDAIAFNAATRGV